MYKEAKPLPTIVLWKGALPIGASVLYYTGTSRVLFSMGELHSGQGLEAK